MFFYIKGKMCELHEIHTYKHRNIKPAISENCFYKLYLRKIKQQFQPLSANNNPTKFKKQLLFHPYSTQTV